jgi:hypothetical protein
MDREKAQDEAFEQEIQAFLRVFPEFSEECPVIDVSAFTPDYGTGPQRLLTAKGTFGMSAWLRFHEQAKPAVRDDMIGKFLEEVEGADALYQAMFSRMAQQSSASVEGALKAIADGFPKSSKWRREGE